MQRKAQRKKYGRRSARLAAARLKGFAELRERSPRPEPAAVLAEPDGRVGTCWRRDGRRKRSYGSPAAAARIAEVHSVTYGHRLTAYECRCGWWHVGRPLGVKPGELGGGKAYPGD